MNNWTKSQTPVRTKYNAWFLPISSMHKMSVLSSENRLHTVQVGNKANIIIQQCLTADYFLRFISNNVPQRENDEPGRVEQKQRKKKKTE